MIPDRWLEKVLVELCDVVVVAAAAVVLAAAVAVVVVHVGVIADGCYYLWLPTNPIDHQSSLKHLLTDFDHL